MMLTARIYVTLKPGVLDAQGDTVKSALETLGFTGVEDVRIGKFMVVTLNSATREQANAQVEEMCRRLLANPVIEEYTFEVEGEDMPPAHRSRRCVSREG
jgi:phosphoribosylformylglycinamidine synthase